MIANATSPCALPDVRMSSTMIAASTAPMSAVHTGD
jgi:hypothetical protein